MPKTVTIIKDGKQLVQFVHEVGFNYLVDIDKGTVKFDRKALAENDKERG